MTPSFDSILFDFDGVLADSEGVHFDCWTAILGPLGIPLTWESYCANCIGITDRAMLEVLANQKNPPHDVEDLWQYYPKKKALFREKAYANPPIPEATRSLLRTLTNYKLAVVSSSGRAEVEPVLERAGIHDCFQTIVTGDDVANRKPHPEPYLLAAERLGVRRPLVVEDSEPGAAAGIAAGFAVLRLENPYMLPTVLLGALSASK
ncbi:MAG: HAD family phosphatase [Bryobacterales bacterium]|nr:HAD family phosphatase [Bryobacterales bacterium]